ncbi:MAG: TetR/AcrR family transcriptional regulator [Bacillota bacterium]
MKLHKKDVIANAAIEVMSQEGFYSATTDKIANEAGISVGLVYYYFSNKEEILEYIFEKECEKRINFLKQIKASDLHSLLKIRKVLNFHFALVWEDPKVAKIIIRERYLPFCTEGGIQKIGGVPLFLKDTIEEGVKKGELRECNPWIISMAIFGIVEEVLNRYILEAEGGGGTNILEEALDQIFMLLDKGLSA